jgi:hypothetical protein
MPIKLLAKPYTSRGASKVHPLQVTCAVKDEYGIVCGLTCKNLAALRRHSKTHIKTPAPVPLFGTQRAIK